MNITRQPIMICVRSPKCVERVAVVYDSLENRSAEGEKNHEQRSKAQKANR